MLGWPQSESVLCADAYSWPPQCTEQAVANSHAEPAGGGDISVLTKPPHQADTKRAEDVPIAV